MTVNIVKVGAILVAQLAASDALLLGRRTFEEFVGFFPHVPSNVPFADHMNGVAKYVVTTHPSFAPGWSNTTVIRAIPQRRSSSLTRICRVAVTGTAR